MSEQARSGSAPVPGLPLLVLRPDGLVLRAGPGLPELLGRPLQGVRLRDLAHTPDDAAAVEELLAAVRDGVPAGDTVLAMDPHTDPEADGRPLRLHLAWAVTDRHDGAPSEVTAFVLDRTGTRDGAVDGAVDGRPPLRAGFEESTAPQAVCDAQGRVTDVNAAFCLLVDHPADELVGRPVHSLSHRSDAGAADSRLARLLRGEVAADRYERSLARADGRPVPVLVDATVLRDAAGRPAGAAAYFQDLTLLRDVERRRQQQEEFFLALSRRASDLALVSDAEGRILYVSPALTQMLGHGAEDVLYARGLDFVHPDDASDAAAMFARVVAESGSATSTLRVRGAGGEWHTVEQTATDLLDTAVGGVVFNLRDVSDRIRAEAALKASEARYRAIADHADEGLWLTAPDGDGIYVNARLVEILGLPESEILGRPMSAVLAAAEVWHGPAGPTDPAGPNGAARPGADRSELVWPHPGGRRRILSVARVALEGERDAPGGWLAMVSDVTDARGAEEQLREAALTDDLTGLPNRARLMQHLQAALVGGGAGTAVLFIDLDRFKIVNDARGHAVGDALLQAVAGRLKAAAGPAHTVARFGGDEFLVVCEDTDEAGACAVAERLLAVLDEPFVVDGGEAVLSASVGVAVTSTTTTGSALLRHADAAMYAAKLAGRSRVRVFDSAMAAQAEDRFGLANDLRRALSRDQLDMHYQPVVDLRTGRVLGAEGLARWSHPNRGSVPPSRFVAVAEDVGLTARLDSWAVARATRDLRTMRATGALSPEAYVAVNISANTLGDPALERWVDAGVAAAGLEPRDVVLELTESAIMVDPASALELLQRLRERGYGIAVDDFGTGHSSLAYLRDLPVTILKIDRTFVAELGEDAGACAIVASIIELAGAVGATVVAEGVETAVNARLLRELGCDAAQGWLWSPAVAPLEAQGTGALARRYDISA
ncbi:sensor domain-containing protein [Nocardioides panaciterrulae]|uniref:Diguanylate cyclase (GGDEF)-like protein/PAS domain S-box-containing protein n=1 Tax=Nocardioides panaciterrulae TaxID=661492 RepID=A0A7Y9E8B8_9ACTN|nr:bifunctional diguanylate cyclase/phosphodiesterase [Nocardioides panaciterrulae]NYD42857.1 diguanylate cyclase (GGDEF)-like protein/PAS domain S-box-containing protein [Nocardioides panaciterrulae]